MHVEGGEFWFRSKLFAIVPGEDAAINPGIYGKALADWLAGKLKERGYLGEIIEEDWGRCIMCQREPVWLWVGCANVSEDVVGDGDAGGDGDGPAEGSGRIPKTEEIDWHCFVECEVPFWKRLFGKGADAGPLLATKLAEDVSAILRGEAGIWLGEEP